jgi:uncharacterized delta-60 repeat protein
MKKLNLVRTIILAGSLLLQLNTLCFQASGAAGDVDLSFDPGSGVNGPVTAVALQPDGKVIIGGQFTTVKGLARSGLARLNADGSGDPTFNPGTGAKNGGVSSVVVQSDGKVIIGGDFNVVNGTIRYGIARLNANGSLDSSFNPVLGAPYVSISSIVLQSDGKVLIGGGFTTVNGTNANGLARLNANGSLDSSFDPGTGWVVASIVVQSDGKILIGGFFTTINGTNRHGIARLNANGSVDNSFNSGTATGGDVSSVAVQPDGKVLFGGYGIGRLKSDGSPDTNFISPSILNYEGDPAWLSSVTLQSDGKVLIGGGFLTVNGTNRNGIARLNANGSLDSSFDPGTSATYASIALQPDGKVIIAHADEFHAPIARLNTDGSLDGSFDPGKEVGSSVSSLVVAPDGKVLIGGVFTFINGTNRYGIQLNADGSRDSTFISNSFNPDIGVPATDYSVANSLLVQPDGKVLIGGYTVTTIIIDPEGDTEQIYGGFLTRFNADGSLDSSFNRVTGVAANSLAQQPDGKLLIGGYGILLRLNSDGSFDNSFNAEIRNYSPVYSVALQSDGKVLIGGEFDLVNGTIRNRIARLNANGSLDSSFNPGTGPNGGVSSIAVQSDGKVLIGGYFTTVNGANRNRIARLNANGSLDSSFNPGTGAEGVVRSIALQPDGKVLIGGDFDIVNGVARPRVARLYGDAVVRPSLNIARLNAFVIVSWPVTTLNFQVQESTNLFPAAWSPVAQPAVTNAGQISVTVPTTDGRNFFRLKSQ